jgi:hypothetical protein
MDETEREPFVGAVVFNGMNAQIDMLDEGKKLYGHYEAMI